MILLQPVEEIYECECSPPVVRPIEQPLNPVTALRNFDLRNFAHPPLTTPSLGSYVACSNGSSHPNVPATYAPPPAPAPAPMYTPPAPAPAPAAPDVYSCKSCGK